MVDGSALTASQNTTTVVQRARRNAHSEESLPECISTTMAALTFLSKATSAAKLLSFLIREEKRSGHLTPDTRPSSRRITESFPQPFNTKTKIEWPSHIPPPDEGGYLCR